MNNSMRRVTRGTTCGLWGTVAVGLCLTVGCGPSGPPRYHLSGTVTHGGQPVPDGSVTLIPDSRAGNNGPAVSLAIKAGKYNTRWEGLGHIGGPHIVRIIGLNGKPDPEFPRGMPLFPDFELKADLQQKDDTQELQIPADWVMPTTTPVRDRGP